MIGSRFADRLIGDNQANVFNGGSGNDTIFGDGPFTGTNYQLNGVAFTYATGANLGNGVAGGTNHVATVASTSLSGLIIAVYDGNNTLAAGETISFQFIDGSGNTIIVNSATVQQTAFSSGTTNTGV